jgi:hypothetical protein
MRCAVLEAHAAITIHVYNTVYFALFTTLYHILNSRSN